jgi:neutral ceramidase
MSLRAAAVEVDITPPTLPIEKPGWIVKILADRVDDPIFAKIVLLESDGKRIGFISLDLLSVRWPEVDRIRMIGQELGIPKDNLMIAATHSHTGPAIASPGLARRNPKYVDWMIEQIGAALKRAIETLQPGRIGIASGIEGRISFIRRCIMKDGSVKTHPKPGPEIRCPESVIDPEVGLLVVQSLSGKTLGTVVNFTCHPTHNGGEPRLSAGWPGQLSLAIKQSIGGDCVVAFLNGALGDAHHQSTIIPDYVDTKERVGQLLAETVVKMLPAVTFADAAAVLSSTRTIQIPLRDIDGPFGVNMKNRQRFAPDGIYETLIARLRAKKTKRDHVLAQVQCSRVGEAAFVSLPCEPFTAIGLEIKMKSPFAPTYVVGCANGMVGYVPTRLAFERGGYETTISMGSKLDPIAGEMLVKTSLGLLQDMVA